ncbi:MAG: HAMP domain-containing histidine kinase [Nitrosomonadales bacterium]|nr:HAMP domain-containing histidine kinase [Nitrosomonadales bacterium]
MSKRESQPDMPMFLASSVHDMKNSISILIGGLERVLGQVTPASFPAYDDVVHMMYETKRINSNLIQLLTLYKVGEDLYPFDPLPQSLDEFALTVMAQHEPLLQSHGVTLELDYDDTAYWQFDEDLVGGVINHAINNAIHYTKDKIKLLIRESEGMLEMRVEDNGAGFPPLMLQEGADAMHGTDFQGGSTGLGIYFSAMVAKMHHRKGRIGGIRLENGGSYGGGCFVLLLP